MQQKKYSLEYFQKLAESRNGKCLSEKYTNCRCRLEFSCNVCNHQWEVRAGHIIEGRWCPKCGFQNGRKYTLDHDFFSRDTEESFYWAGFLLADGWKTKASGGYTIGLQLSIKDYDHLVKFNNTLNSTYPITFKAPSSHKCKYGEIHGGEICCLALRSEKNYKALERFGVIERKTYIAEVPEFVINHKFANHFWRGWADGDGCFTDKKDKLGNIHVDFSAKGSKKALSGFSKILELNKISNERKIHNSQHEDIGNLKYGGNQQISRLYDFLYSNATVFLTRKEIIARQAKELKLGGEKHKTRKSREGSLGFTKESLIAKIREFGQLNLVARHYGCTPANISYWTKFLGIREDVDLILKKKR